MIVSTHVELSTTWLILLAAASCGVDISPAGPFPHARKKPDITLDMLKPLKAAYESDGQILAPNGIRRRLINRKLASNLRRGYCCITDHGRTLIRTQYSALLKVLTNDLTAGGPGV